MDTADLTVEQGATFRVSLTYTDSASVPISLVGYRAHMQIRDKAGATRVIIDLTSAVGGGITLGGVMHDLHSGKIDIYIGATKTALLKKNAAYDLHLVTVNDPDEVTRVFGGAILLTKAVTVT